MRSTISSLLVILFLSIPTMALALEWNEPEIVPEILTRGQRRVLRFSGTAEPGTRIRIKRNRIKMRSLDRRSKWRVAKLPRKTKRLFPLTVSADGTFMFDLYLPTSQVKVPVQVFRGGGWMTYNLRVKVPSSGAAYDFEAMESSFKDTGEDYATPIYVEPQNDEPVGLEPDRSGARDSLVLGKVSGWVGAGFNFLSHDSTNNNSQTSDASFSSIGFPDWTLGLEGRFFQNWLITTNVFFASFAFDKNNSLSLDNDQFNYLLFDVGTSYRPKNFKLSAGQLGADVGIYYQSMPFIVQQQFGFTDHSVKSSDYFSIYGGMSFEVKTSKRIFSSFLRLSIPLTSGSAYAIDSGIGFHGEAGVYFKVSPTWYLGGFANLSYRSSDVNFDVNGSASKFTGSHKLMAGLFTARLRTDF